MIDDLVERLRDFPAPEYIDGKPTATYAERLIFEAADRIAELEAAMRKTELERDGWIRAGDWQQRSENAIAECERLRKDAERLDVIAALTIKDGIDQDVTIYGPGNHGGKLPWLIARANWNNPGEANDEWEGSTLRTAIDAAIGEKP